MASSPEVSSSFSGPFYNGCFILNISRLAERTIYARIQADHLNEVALFDVYKEKMIETQHKSKSLEYLSYVALALFINLVTDAIAWGIYYAFFLN